MVLTPSAFRAAQAMHGELLSECSRRRMPETLDNLVTHGPAPSHQEGKPVCVACMRLGNSADWPCLPYQGFANIVGVDALSMFNHYIETSGNESVKES
jgi:hypothetical protein